MKIAVSLGRPWAGADRLSCFEVQENAPAGLDFGIDEPGRVRSLIFVRVVQTIQSWRERSDATRVCGMSSSSRRYASKQLIEEQVKQKLTLIRFADAISGKEPILQTRLKLAEAVPQNC